MQISKLQVIPAKIHHLWLKQSVCIERKYENCRCLNYLLVLQQESALFYEKQVSY